MESSRKSYSGRCPWADRPAHLWDSSPLARLWGQWQREQCGEVLVQPPEGVGAEGLPAFPHLQGLIEASALPEEGHFQCQQLLYAELGEHKMEVAQHKAVFADSSIRASGHGATCPASTSVLPAWGQGPCYCLCCNMKPWSWQQQQEEHLCFLKLRLSVLVFDSWGCVLFTLTWRAEISHLCRFLVSLKFIMCL